jgi:tRNA U38,U39,U40 pseudouridine synthase TruA
MVRIMCGYLISVALDKQEQGKIPYYLKNTEKKVTTKTAVATGLYLKEVKY